VWGKNVKIIFKFEGSELNVKKGKNENEKCVGIGRSCAQKRGKVSKKKEIFKRKRAKNNQKCGAKILEEFFDYLKFIFERFSHPIPTQTFWAIKIF
jgi:hypothetical protein